MSQNAELDELRVKVREAEEAFKNREEVRKLRSRLKRANEDSFGNTFVKVGLGFAKSIGKGFMNLAENYQRNLEESQKAPRRSGRKR